MTTITFTHIVPALPPQIDDVGGYVLNLALRLQQSHGIESRFVVCDPQWNGPSRVEGFVVRRLRFRTEAGIWSLLASREKASKEMDNAVLLHYAGRGYDNLGVPIWLYRGISSWLGEHTGRFTGNQKPFCTVFHESLEPCAEPWKIEFYLRNLRKSLLRKLHHRSRLSVTRTRCMHQMLEAFEPHKTLWLPTPSNVPVAVQGNHVRCRNGSLRAVILGHSDSRAKTVKAHANLLRTLDVKGRLASTTLLGMGSDATGVQTEDVRLLRQCVSPERIGVPGQLSPADVSLHLFQYLYHAVAGADTD
jgi:hypothetical protein